MIQVVNNNEIRRGGVKIGRVDGDHIYDHNGNKVAYFSSTEVFDMTGKRIAYIEGEYVYLPRNGEKVRIEDNSREVGGMVSDACKAAIRLALG
ncbi:MAG: 4-fold beta flower protein [Minisyncoccia bacterium]|jgi:hypothetical protein